MQQPTSVNKLFYIDNIRVLLTVLVIMHHTCITYGAPGGWYFTDKSTNETALIFMTMFVAVNQAFFMGFFFFLAALFTPSSYNKKKASKFLADRSKRLGIPLLFYSFIFSPVLNFIVYKFGEHKQATFLQFLNGYDDWIDFGVLWFVAALLIFTFAYVLIKKLFPAQSNKKTHLPRNTYILLFALALGIISYLVRIIFPVGWVLHPLGFQFGHFTQYIALFTIGIIAAKNNWLSEISESKPKHWRITAVILLVVFFPILYVVKTVTNSSIDSFQGGGTSESLLSAVWEQLIGISIIMAMLGTAYKRWNYSTPLLKTLSRAAFATYILHPLTIITIAILLQSWQIEPAIKFLIAAPIAVCISFLIGIAVTKIPVVKSIV